MSEIKVKVKINVPFDKWTDEIEAVREEGMRDLMMKAYGAWQDAAARTLHSTKRMYQEAIQHKLVDGRTVHLFLSHNDEKKNWLVNALELGHGPMDPTTKTLASPKASRFSSMAKRANQTKVNSWAKIEKDNAFVTTQPPFMDVPIWGKGKSPIEGGKPLRFRRMTPGNATKFIHPGFKPEGSGGLDKPLREEVIQLVKDEAPPLFKKLIEQVVKA